MSDPSARRRAPAASFLAATLLAGLAAALCAPALAADPGLSLVDSPAPPAPSSDQVGQAAATLGSPLNNPITGSSERPVTIGGERPPSLEALQASRPGFNPTGDLDGPRGEALHEAALSFGARGGLAARGFAINDILRRNEARLDAAYDFRSLVVSVGPNQTLMRPPVVTEAQMAFALGDGGQVARETGRVYEITRQAQLASAPPNWRGYLVRTWANPTPPPDDLRPRSKQEVEYWNKWVAEGWARGERQAVEIFLSDLGRLEGDLVGMARYRVLLRANLVEQPRVTFANRAVQGGRDMMRVDDRTITITDQPGLNANRRQWRGGPPEMALPAEAPAPAVSPYAAPPADSPVAFSPSSFNPAHVTATPLPPAGPIRIAP